MVWNFVLLYLLLISCIRKDNVLIIEELIENGSIVCFYFRFVILGSKFYILFFLEE